MSRIGNAPVALPQGVEVSFNNGEVYVKGKLGELFHCPLCLGFWVGVFLWAVNRYTELFSFDISLGNGFVLSCISAGTSYLISVLVDDFGLRLSSRSGGEYVDD